MKNILKILILLSLCLNVSFGLDLVRSGNIVHDYSTKLQWVDDDNVKTSRKSWEHAKTYCKNLVLDGRYDWRLPNKNELITLIDFNKSDPVFKEDVFKNMTSNYYWSSVPNAALSDYAWFISFDTGLIGYTKKINLEYVRCVRTSE